MSAYPIVIGSELGCSIAVHTRCSNQVAGSCAQQYSLRREELPAPAPAGKSHLPRRQSYLSSLILVGPSLFGRDLAEQIKADSKDEPRTIPVIVEKCINAVDTLGTFSCLIRLEMILHVICSPGL